MDARALLVQDHGIFEGRREHASLFESDDEEVWAPGKGGVTKARDVEVAGPGTIDAHGQRLDALANEAQRLADVAPELAQHGELADGLAEASRRRMIECARL